MKVSEFRDLQSHSHVNAVDYSSLSEGCAVDFPLQGRTAKRMQLTLLSRAKRLGWDIETVIKGDKLIVLTNSLCERVEMDSCEGSKPLEQIDSGVLHSMDIGDAISIEDFSFRTRYQTQRMVHAYANNYSKKFKSKTSDGVLYVKRVS